MGAGSVAIIHRNRREIAVHIPGIMHKIGEDLLLVLGQRLGGIDVQSAAIGIVQQAIQDGQVETQSLPAGRSGNDNHILPCLGGLPGIELVSI